MHSLLSRRFAGRSRFDIWRRAVRDGLFVAAIGYTAFILAGAVVNPNAFMDSHAYWAARPAAPYVVSQVGARDAYLYSPAFLEFIWPLKLLPLPAFAEAIEVCSVAALIAQTGPLLGVAMLYPPTHYELLFGNVNFLLALAIVAGFRFPALWSTVLLTKVTPGVGLLWFAVRREWHSLLVALAATAAVACISFVLSPEQWGAWVAVLAKNAEHQTGLQLLGPLAVRLPVAAALIAWGAHTDRRWTVVAGATLATPALSLVSASMLLGVIPLVCRTSVVGRWISQPLPMATPVDLESLEGDLPSTP
jgi:hypothetical protein